MLALAKGEIHLIFGSNVFLIRLVFGAALVGGSIWLIWSASQSQNTVDSTCGTWQRNGFFPHFFLGLIKRQLCAKWGKCGILPQGYIAFKFT